MDLSNLTFPEQRKIWKRMFPIKWLVIYGFIMHSDKLFPGSYSFSSIQYFESTLPFFHNYGCRNYVLVPANACLGSIRSRTTDMMYMSKWRLASLSAIHAKLTLKIHLVIVAFMLRYHE